LPDNNFSKYLIYAAGEIVHVVIGILIALQINNWNETRKDRLFEIKMLNEIQKALDNDIKDFEYLISRMQRLDSATLNIAKKIHGKALYNDSLSSKDDIKLNVLYTGAQYQYNRGPYDAVKASGIDKISNDSLRNELINLYDFTFPRNSEITRWADRDYNQQIEKVKSFLGKTEIIIENEEINFKRTFNQDLLNNQEFIDLLYEINRRGKSVGGSLNFMVTKMIEIRNQIILEIDRK
jgi:hypothetical protein